jgi:hypothetical protein
MGMYSNSPLIMTLSAFISLSPLLMSPLLLKTLTETKTSTLTPTQPEEERKKKKKAAADS